MSSCDCSTPSCEFVVSLQRVEGALAWKVLLLLFSAVPTMGTQGSVPQCGTNACCQADVNSEHMSFQQNRPIVRNDLAVSKAISPTRSEARDSPLTNQQAQPYAAQVEAPSPEPVPEPIKPVQESVPKAPVIEEKNPVKAEEAPRELDVQVVRQESPIPGMYGLTLTRSLGEKWGMEVDYGQGPNLKIQGIHDFGPVANYNDNNPKRLVEANDWIVEIDGEMKTAKQMAMHLAETDLVSISLIIRKHFTVDEKGNNRKD